MTQKTIMIGLVAVAFVAGSIMTGTMASAQQGGVGDNLIIDALNSIATAITGIPDPTVDVDVTVPEDAIQVDVVGVEGPTGDKGSTGDQGPVGEQGPAGPVGSIKTYTLNTSGQGNANALFSVLIQCDDGDIAVGGGVETPEDTRFIASIPIKSSNSPANRAGDVATGWELIGLGETSIGGAGAVFVICIDNPPLRGSLPPIVVIP